MHTLFKDLEIPQKFERDFPNLEVSFVSSRGHVFEYVFTDVDTDKECRRPGIMNNVRERLLEKTNTFAWKICTPPSIIEHIYAWR